MQSQPRPSLRAVLEAGQKHARAFNKQQPPSATTGVHNYTSNVPVVHAELLLGEFDGNGKPFLPHADNPSGIEYTLSEQYPDGRPKISWGELDRVVRRLTTVADLDESVIFVNYGKVPEFDLRYVLNPKKNDDREFQTLSRLLHDVLEKEWHSPRGPIVYLK